MTDPVLITRKARLILQDLDELKPIAAQSLDAFLADRIAQVLAERYLERMIGRMIDINFHLITESGGAPPSDYFQSFTELGRMAVLPADFARRIAPAAGLRNRLVHEYDEIDPSRLYEALRTAVSDVPEYLRHVMQWSSEDKG